MFRSTRKGKNFFVMSLHLSDHKVLHNVIASSSSFFQFRSNFLAFFHSYFVLQNLDLRNLIKQLFHLRLLDMRLVIAYTPHWLFDISYPMHAHGIIVNYHRSGS